MYTLVVFGHINRKTKKVSIVVIIIFVIFLLSLASYLIYNKYNLKVSVSLQPNAQPNSTLNDTQGALGSDFNKSARDTRRKMDVSDIAVATKLYINENGLPSDFPTQPTCIGISSTCYDLFSLKGKYYFSNYISVLPKDPLTGSSATIGYSIWLVDKNTIKVSAQGEIEEQIFKLVTLDTSKKAD